MADEIRSQDLVLGSDECRLGDEESHRSKATAINYMRDEGTDSISSSANVKAPAW